MIWLQPAAALALAAVLAPLLLHLLARRRAVRLAFPTLRFVQPTRLASLRTRALEDPALLALRVALIAAAVAAAAGPLLQTARRRQAADARTIQTVVNDRRQLPGAIAWLQQQPPARREVVFRSAFPIGSVTAADLAGVPADIGLRFERSGPLPATRTVPAGGTLAAAERDGARAVEAIGREVDLAGDRTSVRDTARGGTSALAIEIVTPEGERDAADAILDTLLRDRVSAPADGRRARVVFGAAAAPSAPPPREPWMGDAAARVEREGFSRAPLRFGALDGRLIVETTAPASDPDAPALVRAVFDALAPSPPSNVETVAIADRELQAWARPAGPAPRPSRETIRDDDRRWFWAAALLLLGAEWRLRRRRVVHEDQAGEVSRVA